LKKNNLKFLSIFILLVFSNSFGDELFYIPLEHYSYKYIEKLASVGLISMEKINKKPYTYQQVKEWTIQAIEKIKKGEFRIITSGNDIEQCLLRLKKDFLEEKKVNMDINIDLNYANFDVKKLNMPNYNGRDIYDGLNLKGKFDYSYSDKNFSFSISPSIFYNDEDRDLYLESGYINYLFKNILISIGRNEMWWGPGYHGSLIFSNNNFPFDRIMIGNNEPFYYPWIFKKLGPSYYTFFISMLDENNRRYPHPFITGHRFEVNPKSYLSFGLNYKIILAGEGKRKDIYPWNYLRIFLGRSEDVWGEERFVSNGEISWDFKWAILNLDKYLRFLGQYMEVYGEFGREVSTHTFYGWINSPEGVLFGIYLPSAFNIDGLDFRVEYGDTYWQKYKNFWYVSGGYPSYYKGDVIGHHIGPDANDIYFEISKRLTDNLEIVFNYDKENRYKSKEYVEERNYFGLNFNYIPCESDLLLNFGLNYIKIENINNEATGDKDNLIFGFKINYKF